MKLPLQVSFHGIDRSEALENLIAKEVEGLHKFDADLISCRVAVEGGVRAAFDSLARQVKDNAAKRRGN